MATVTKLGPADHGRPMGYEEFLSGDYEPGYKYELIDGRLYVSPEANMPENFIEVWILGKLMAYEQEHPGVINYVTTKARVFVPDRPEGITAPEPDLAAYQNYPRRRGQRAARDWQQVSPVLVAEILLAGDPVKDLERNVELYLQVSSIREYWVFDGREDEEWPSLRVYRRRGQRWQAPIDISAGETYTTRLLPGFELIVDPFL
jgi:Uma2 family endonuclease